MNKQNPMSVTRGREESPRRLCPHDDQCEFRRVKVSRCGCYQRHLKTVAATEAAKPKLKGVSGMLRRLICFGFGCKGSWWENCRRCGEYIPPNY